MLWQPFCEVTLDMYHIFCEIFRWTFYGILPRNLYVEDILFCWILDNLIKTMESSRMFINWCKYLLHVLILYNYPVKQASYLKHYSWSDYCEKTVLYQFVIWTCDTAKGLYWQRFADSSSLPGQWSLGLIILITSEAFIRIQTLVRFSVTY